MLEDLVLGKKVITAIGSNLTEEEQQTLSTYREYFPNFLSTQEGISLCQLVGAEFVKYINSNLTE